MKSQLSSSISLQLTISVFNLQQQSSTCRYYLQYKIYHSPAKWVAVYQHKRYVLCIISIKYMYCSASPSKPLIQLHVPRNYINTFKGMPNNNPRQLQSSFSQKNQFFEQFPQTLILFAVITLQRYQPHHNIQNCTWGRSTAERKYNDIPS